MEQELFFSGYCRCLDRSRMVIAIVEDGKLTEADCDYPVCPWSADCPIGEKLRTAVSG